MLTNAYLVYYTIFAYIYYLLAKNGVDTDENKPEVEVFNEVPIKLALLMLSPGPTCRRPRRGPEPLGPRDPGNQPEHGSSQLPRALEPELLPRFDQNR